MAFLFGVAGDDHNSTEAHPTSANSTTHDTPFVEEEYCGRSIVFAARKLVV
jgi:hypothetical protein